MTDPIHETLVEAVTSRIDGDAYILQRWPWLYAAQWAFNKIGMPTILIVFGMGVWTGQISSPLTDIATDIRTSVVQTDKLIRLIREEKLSSYQPPKPGEYVME